MSNKKSAGQKKKMADIARLAGVSESTVSRALSGSSLVSAATRERIQTLAQEQNYSINKQAQNLRLQSSRTVSVIIPIDHEPKQHISDPFFLELLGAIADAITEADYDLLLSRVHTNDWRKRVARHSYVDGLVIIGQSVLHEEINEFALHNPIPLVVWGHQFPHQTYISIGSDNRLGGYQAAEHLLGLGRRRIVFLGDRELPEVASRYQGYCQAHQAAGISCDPQLAHTCSFTPESAAAAVSNLLSSGQPFDSIFAASDVLASIAIKHLHAANLRIPQDVAVVGFDNIAIARHVSPALTTVSQNITQGGHLIVDNLFQQIRGETTHSELIAPHLILRDTA